MAPLSDTPEIDAHFIEVNQLTLIDDPLGQFRSERSSLILESRLMHSFPRYLLPLGEGDTGPLVQLVQTVPIESVVRVHTFQKLCSRPHTKMGPFLHTLPAGNVLEHSIGDFRPDLPNLPAVWWMLIVILDEPLNSIVHVDRPASHNICYLGVGTSWVTKVIEATKPESDHSVPVVDGEVSVPATTIPHWLGYRL